MKNKFVFAIFFAALNISIDFVYFNITGVIAHIYVVFAELILQVVILVLTGYRNGIDSEENLKQRILFQLFYNTLNIALKCIFLYLLLGASSKEDFSYIFPFASGEKNQLVSIADANSDAIANILYQCNSCVGLDRIPLSEPFIVYVYVFISKLAGEFNQSIIWLTFHIMNFVTAAGLLKASDKLLGNIKYPLAIPLIYLLISDSHAANLALFKDVVIIFMLVSIYYINSIYIFEKKIKPMSYELIAILLLACLYGLRSGMLAAIIFLSITNIIIDPKKKVQHLRILLLAGIVVCSVLYNNNPSHLHAAAVRLINKVAVGSSSGLDVQNLTYTVSVDSSFLNRHGLNEVTTKNFFYAPFVKGALYFLLPLPVNQSVNVPDYFNKLSTVIYSILFLLFLIGIYKIILRRDPKELYLLLLFSLCMATILGAGPMIYPRYRIMASGFFVLIVFIGISRISTELVKKVLLISIIGVTVVILSYQNIYHSLLVSAPDHELLRRCPGSHASSTVSMQETDSQVYRPYNGPIQHRLTNSA